MFSTPFQIDDEVRRQVIARTESAGERALGWGVEDIGGPNTLKSLWLRLKHDEKLRGVKRKVSSVDDVDSIFASTPKRCRQSLNLSDTCDMLSDIFLEASDDDGLNVSFASTRTRDGDDPPRLTGSETSVEFATDGTPTSSEYNLSPPLVVQEGDEELGSLYISCDNAAVTHSLDSEGGSSYRSDADGLSTLSSYNEDGSSYNEGDVDTLSSDSEDGSSYRPTEGGWYTWRLRVFTDDTTGVLVNESPAHSGTTDAYSCVNNSGRDDQDGAVSAGGGQVASCERTQEHQTLDSENCELCVELNPDTSNSDSVV